MLMSRVRGFYIIAAVFSGMMILCSLLGDFTRIGEYENQKPRGWEKFSVEFVEETPTLDSLHVAVKKIDENFQNLSDKDKMGLFFDAVSMRFTHRGKTPKHNVFTNWVLYLSGFLHPTLSGIWNPDTHLRKGHSLFCSQVSYVLLSLAVREGIPVRHVNLNGHVVMEAWYDANWHMYDPDMEVVVTPSSSGEILSVEEISVSQQLLDRYYPRDRARRLQDFFRSREDNSFAAYPVGVHFEWKTQLLSKIEKLMEVFKYVLPLLVLLALVVRLFIKK